MNTNDLNYLAALFDSEGSVTVLHHYRSHRKGDPRVHELYAGIGSTHQPIIHWVHNLLGYGFIHKKKTAGMPGVRLPMWYWEISCANAEQFIRTIQPFVKIKKAHCEEALIFRLAQREIGNREYNQCFPLRKLNRREEPCSLVLGG